MTALHFFGTWWLGKIKIWLCGYAKKGVREKIHKKIAETLRTLKFPTVVSQGRRI